MTTTVCIGTVAGISTEALERLQRWVNDPAWDDYCAWMERHEIDLGMACLNKDCSDEMRQRFSGHHMELREHMAFKKAVTSVSEQLTQDVVSKRGNG